MHGHRYLDVSCLVFGADHGFVEPIDYDHRISTEAVGKQGAVQHSGEGPLRASMQPRSKPLDMPFAQHMTPARSAYANSSTCMTQATF